MKLIVCLVLIYCIVEAVHCSKPWRSYLKRFDSSSVDFGDNDHGLVMPLQVRTSYEYYKTLYKLPNSGFRGLSPGGDRVATVGLATHLDNANNVQITKYYTQP